MPKKGKKEKRELLGFRLLGFLAERGIYKRDWRKKQTLCCEKSIVVRI